ncbi:MAG: LuxR C-terminal-related transcriptional regulator [Pseudomonadota bacterium]
MGRAVEIHPITRIDTAETGQLAGDQGEGIDIARYRDALGVAPATVRTHLGTIYRKLGVGSKIALLRMLQTLQASPHPSAPETVAPPTGLSRLPARRRAMIGREREVADIRALLGRDNVELLTLTGPDGSGKTRLSLEIGAQMAADFAIDFAEGSLGRASDGSSRRHMADVIDRAP